MQPQLNTEYLLESRIAGRTYQEIADATGCKIEDVKNFVRGDVPLELRGRYGWQDASARRKVQVILEIKGPDVPVDQLARWAACAPITAYIYRRTYLQRKRAVQLPTRGESGGRCAYCDVEGWPKNPIINNVCLWCWAQFERLALSTLVEELGWAAVLQALAVPVEGPCACCDELALTPAFVDPPLCAAHYEAALVVRALRRRGRPITPEHAERQLQRGPIPLHVTAEALPGLIAALRALPGEPVHSSDNASYRN
jgi:hypothetical protein